MVSPWRVYSFGETLKDCCRCFQKLRNGKQCPRCFRKHKMLRIGHFENSAQCMRSHSARLLSYSTRTFSSNSPASFKNAVSFKIL
eukprot:IDg18919t1